MTDIPTFHVLAMGWLHRFAFRPDLWYWAGGMLTLDLDADIPAYELKELFEKEGYTKLKAPSENACLGTFSSSNMQLFIFGNGLLKILSSSICIFFGRRYNDE